jgi:RNA polymerase sigma factor (sigma-70 family)
MEEAPFPGTRWSLVGRLVETRSRIGSGTRRRAFEELALAYWRPVYRALRVAHRVPPEEAEDLTQAFFLGLFEKGTLEKFEADPDAGRFRALLRSLLDAFVRTAQRDARRKKRGGEHRRVPLDPHDLAALEQRIARAPEDDPFEREWRATVIDRALAEMARDAESPIWKRRHAIFLAHDVEPAGDERPTYAELAKRFDVEPHDVKNDLVAARRRFAELVLDRLRDECRDEDEARDEMEELFGRRDAGRLAGVARAHVVPETVSGDRVGIYRIVDKVGRGSAGEVFRALDPDGHRVALKILHRRWRGERYLRELELLERASAFDGVVALLDAGSSDRGPFLVLELAEGGSLRARLNEKKRLEWPEAARLIGDVARTLSALHAEGIVHRDLKPENILLDRDGRPLVSDFGLAKDLMEADGELTMAGMALGTVGYMAPELLDGRRDRLGPWTDVFSLAAVLYELCAGELPFTRRTLAEAARAIQNDPPRPLAGVPAALNAVVKRGLAKEPADRFPDAGALAKAIGEISS